jgi:two-component system phosphate regulon sensor histidine kinase PhoR
MATTTSERVRQRRVRPRLSRAIAAKRRAQVSLLILLLLLGAVLAVGVYASHDLYHSAEDRYLGVVLPLQSATRNLQLHVVEEETGMRGYMITADRSSLKPYFIGSSGVENDLARISLLTQGRPELTARMNVLKRQINGLRGFYDSLITFVADGRLGQDLAKKEVLDSAGLFSQFTKTSRLMQNDLARLVQATRLKQARTYDRAIGALVAAGVLALLIAFWLLLKVPERLRILYAAEEEARLDAEQDANSARALAHVSDAVLLIDDSQRVRSWNEAAETLFGASRATAIARKAEDVVPEYERLVEGGRRRDAFVPITVAGDERWVAPALSTFDGGTVLTVRDVTGRYQLERARADFVTTASHELRTPLTAIYGGVRTLLGRAADLREEQRLRLLRMIEQESAHLAQIVDQLLITAQLDRGSLRANAAPVDLRALCASVLEAAEARSPEEATLELVAPPALDPVLCDESLLRQVLVNLVENAVKYSPDGGHIELKLAADRNNVRIAVQDEGLGIPPSEQEQIFEKFYRLDAGMTRGVGGSGLGLFISREIVTQMDGTLTVRSRPGSGSTFTVTLPRRAA